MMLHRREAGYVGFIGLVNSQILFANEVVKPHKVCVYQCPTHLATNQLRWHGTLYFQGQQTWNPS